LIATSSNQLFFYGEHDHANLDRTISIIGLVDQKVDVSIVTAELYNNNSGESIPNDKVEITPSSFSLTKNEVETVNISLKTAESSVGTYQGTVLVTASTATANVTVSNIAITAKIDIEHQFLVKNIIIGLILTFFIVSLLFGLFQGKFPSKTIPKSLCIGIGFLAVAFWVYLQITPAISFVDTGNIISTILIVPLTGYLIYVVKGAKDDSEARNKPKTTVPDYLIYVVKGVKDNSDIEEESR
jgi:hypothetical protein